LIASQPALLTPPAPARSSAREHRHPLLAVSDLHVHFGRPGRLARSLGRGHRHVIHAVNGVSLSVQRGGSLGIVGESGSGKSTVARTIVGLVTPSSGRVTYNGQPITWTGAQGLKLRRAVQMVFQDPYLSLDPAMSIAQILAEPIRTHRLCPERKLRERLVELLQMVELPATLLSRRPGQLSGGQRQRIGIARALALEPELIIADEVTSALDVTIQAQVLGLFDKLRRAMNLTLVLISHDLAVVRYLCESVAVMRHGRIVEYGRTEEVFDRPREAYTRELIAAIPLARAPVEAPAPCEVQLETVQQGIVP
jgi:peptide/nickel transport system ATP-binding protein